MSRRGAGRRCPPSPSGCGRTVRQDSSLMAWAAPSPTRWRVPEAARLLIGTDCLLDLRPRHARASPVPRASPHSTVPGGPSLQAAVARSSIGLRALVLRAFTEDAPVPVAEHDWLAGSAKELAGVGSEDSEQRRLGLSTTSFLLRLISRLAARDTLGFPSRMTVRDTTRALVSSRRTFTSFWDEQYRNSDAFLPPKTFVTLEFA